MEPALEYEIERQPLIVSFAEAAAFTETYGFAGSGGMVFLEGQLLLPKARASTTLVIFMHPASTLNLMPLPAAMARAGHHVLCAASRFAKNDTALIMEKVAADLGAYVKHARAALGYRHVVLGGWSGGGALAMFYQSQAEQPTVTQTPAGDAYDLASFDLQPADAVMFIAAHTGRARLMREWIDPSMLDEADPDRRDPVLDIYDPANPAQPPYSPQFIQRYRAAQGARVDRITARVRQTLAELRRRNGAEIERPFIVHRTMADPRFLDPALEFNGRKARWCYLGNPETVNSGPVGIGRYSTLRAWLSQWASDASKADAVQSASAVSVPLLVVENGADDAVPPSHLREVLAAATMRDKTFLRIEGATHYYRDQPEHCAEAVGRLATWMAERNFA